MSETQSEGACFHLVWKISRYATGCRGCGALPIAAEGSPVGGRWWIRPLTLLIVVPAGVAAAPTIDIPTIEDLRSAIAKVGWAGPVVYAAAYAALVLIPLRRRSPRSPRESCNCRGEVLGQLVTYVSDLV